MFEENFIAQNKHSYRITIDDEGELISVYFHNQPLGTISLSYREDGDEYKGGTYSWYHITHLALTSPDGQGIARACLLYHKDCFDCKLTAGRADGASMSDGSHLTGRGVGFIARMREEGIVEKLSDDLPSSENDG